MKPLGYIQESKHVLVGKVRKLLNKRLRENQTFDDWKHEFNKELDKLLWLKK